MNSTTHPRDEWYLMARGVTKTFGHVVALRDVSLGVRRGEFVCVLGPSGCGKSTLLRVIAGFEELNTGTIIQEGRDVSRLPPSQRDFGIVFQSYALFPNLTVVDNVAYGLHDRRMKRVDAAARVAKLLDLVGLSELGFRYPAQLSGGQQQRVALARALALSPSLLLLDEPLSALDARVRAGLRAEIVALHRRLGVTTIMVTHDQEEALTMSDRVVVMDKGEIVQVGTPLEIYQGPANSFVADFVGVMNFLPAVMDGSADTARCGDTAFRAAPATSASHGLASGSPVVLAIRPEEVHVAWQHADEPNSVLAELDRMEFVGPSYRLRLRLRLGKPEPPAVIVTHLPRAIVDQRQPHVGDLVSLVLPPQYLRLFPVASGAASTKQAPA